MSTAANTLTLKKTASFYDRIADVHNLALKLNGYRDSVAKFLKSLEFEIGPDSMVLDAGSGTGIVTLAFHQAGFRPAKTVAFDLSGNSLQIASEQFGKEKYADSKNIVPVQGNILRMPFADESFDLIFGHRGLGRTARSCAWAVARAALISAVQVAMSAASVPASRAAR